MKKQIKFNTDTIPEFLYRRAKTLPNNIAYSFPEFMQEYSWSRIWAEVNLLSKSFLRLEIKKKMVVLTTWQEMTIRTGIRYWPP